MRLIWILFSAQIFHLLLPFTVTKLVTSHEISKAVESRDTKARNRAGFDLWNRGYNDLWAGRLVLDRRNATASRSN